ncbi:hypothetical protein CHY08_15135 [Rhizobium leguminosarum bv. viciae]|nr:hypothetical protein CHY08_15135 [Rhizobium leguminosarum bv. viciae]
MFLRDDSPRKAANFGIPKRGNFGIPKWDFFLRADAPGLCRGQSAGGIRRFPIRIGRFWPDQLRPLALLVKLEGRAFGQTECPERQACSIAQRTACETRGCRFPHSRKPRTRTKSDTGARMNIRPFRL